MSMFAEVKFLILYFRFLATVNALRKTSGRTTAEPRLVITPFSNFEMEFVRILKSAYDEAPSAAPSHSGC